MRERGELQSEQGLALDEQLVALVTNAIARVDSVPTGDPMPDDLAGTAQTIDATLAERRAALATSAQALAGVLDTLANPIAPADELPGGYEHMSALAEGLAAGARSTAALVRLRNAMHVRGWLP